MWQYHHAVWNKKKRLVIPSLHSNRHPNKQLAERTRPKTWSIFSAPAEPRVARTPDLMNASVACSPSRLLCRPSLYQEIQLQADSPQLASKSPCREVTFMHKCSVCMQPIHPSVQKSSLAFFFGKDFIYLFILERRREKERERTSMCGCLSRALYWGPGPQPSE